MNDLMIFVFLVILYMVIKDIKISNVFGVDFVFEGRLLFPTISYIIKRVSI